MDMGVIHSIKSRYRLKLARKLLAILDSGLLPTSKNIDLYDALIMLKNSWDEISEEIIMNCFIKSGININNLTETENNEEIDTSLWPELTQQLSLESLSFEDFVNFDNEIAINNDLINPVVDNQSDSNTEIDSDFTEENDNIGEQDSGSIKLLDAVNAISVLRKYFTQCECLDKNYKLINEIENQIYFNKSKNFKQTKITDFFV